MTGRRSNQLSYNSSEKAVKLELNRGGFNRKFSKKRKGGRKQKGRSRGGDPCGLASKAALQGLPLTASQARQRSRGGYAYGLASEAALHGAATL